MKSIASAVGVLAIVAALTTACAGGEGAGGEEDTAPQADAITVHDPWVKAAEGPMTAAFGSLRNSADSQARVVAARTEAAGTVELHEIVDHDGAAMMQEKDGGFVIPAAGASLLEPGADHLMLMDLPGPIGAGETISVTLEFEDGSEYTFDAPAKEYSGANEEYAH